MGQPSTPTVPFNACGVFTWTLHMEMMFPLGGIRYALLLVDHCTRYVWVYGMKDTSGDAVIEALWVFLIDCRADPTRIQRDFDKCLLAGAARRFLSSCGIREVGAPSHHQLQNGLAKSTWASAIAMARSYLVNGRVPRSFWFPAISLGYYSMEREGGKQLTNFQSQSHVGVAIGRARDLKVLEFYNPYTNCTATSADYTLDKNRETEIVFPNLRYDGSFKLGLHSERDAALEPFPPRHGGVCAAQKIGDTWTRPHRPPPVSSPLPRRTRLLFDPAGHGQGRSD